jgi:hypothetical protein
MSDDENGSLRITLKDVWKAQQDGTKEVTAAIVDLKESFIKVTGHLETIDSWNADSDKYHADVENRLRALERWRYALPTSIVLTLASGTAGVTALFIHH